MFIPSDEFLMTDNDTDYLFYSGILKKIIKVKRSFNGYYDNEKGDDININITSPYQLNKDFSLSPHGFFIFDLKQNEIKFVENTYSPKFKEIYIEDISELANINIDSKDIIDLVVKSKAIEKIENKNKLDIFVSKYINNVYFTDDYSQDKEIIIKDNNDIRDILIENANDEMIDNLKEIFTIYDNDSRYNNSRKS